MERRISLVQEKEHSSKSKRKEKRTPGDAKKLVVLEGEFIPTASIQKRGKGLELWPREMGERVE